VSSGEHEGSGGPAQPCDVRLDGLGLGPAWRLGTQRVHGSGAHVSEETFAVPLEPDVAAQRITEVLGPAENNPAGHRWRSELLSLHPPGRSTAAVSLGPVDPAAPTPHGRPLPPAARTIVRTTDSVGPLRVALNGDVSLLSRVRVGVEQTVDVVALRSVGGFPPVRQVVLHTSAGPIGTAELAPGRVRLERRLERRLARGPVAARVALVVWSAGTERALAASDVGPVHVEEPRGSDPSSLRIDGVVESIADIAGGPGPGGLRVARLVTPGPAFDVVLPEGPVSVDLTPGRCVRTTGWLVAALRGFA